MSNINIVVLRKILPIGKAYARPKIEWCTRGEARHRKEPVIGELGRGTLNKEAVTTPQGLECYVVNPQLHCDCMEDGMQYQDELWLIICMQRNSREKRTFIDGRQSVEYRTFGAFGSGTPHLRCISFALRPQEKFECHCQKRRERRSHEACSASHGRRDRDMAHLGDRPSRG